MNTALLSLVVEQQLFPCKIPKVGLELSDNKRHFEALLASGAGLHVTVQH